MKTVTVNNKLGHRDRQHKNILAVNGEKPCFLLFSGESIPGVCRVLNSDYTKNGKWSHTTWKLQLPDGVTLAVHSQDWGTGSYTNARTWDLAISDFLSLFEGLTVNSEDVVGGNPKWINAAERFIRAVYPQAATELDLEENKAEEVAPISELIEAQERLAVAQKEAARAKAEIGQLIAAREAEEKAAELQKKTVTVSEKLKEVKKLPLQELQELYRKL